jgi:hypothetical protein
MTKHTLHKEIEEAVLQLLDMARKLSWNKISDNCRFILTEIKDSHENFHVQRVLRKRENDRKVPKTLEELMPDLQQLYDDFYEINLHIYIATKNMTIIDFRYFPKSSLDEEYRQLVLPNPPMLHCKVEQPPRLSEKNGKFDINWEHKQWLINWKLFWSRRKLLSRKPFIFYRKNRMI